MPRKTPVRELQKEETTVSSPLRRSSRINTSSPVPTAIKTRRSSASETATSTPKVTKSRRSSFSQELETPNENENESKSSKTPRTRKGSFSSKNNENNGPEEEFVTKRGTRASSITKEQTSDVKKPVTRRRRSSSQEVEMNEEKPVKITKGRSNSVTKKNEKSENEKTKDASGEIEPEVTGMVKKSTNKLDETSENGEIVNDGSLSPVVNEPKSNVAKKRKVDLELSVIKEASLTEEDILQEESKSSLSSSHDENLKEYQSEEITSSKKTKKSILSADITTEMSTKTESEAKLLKKLVVNLTEKDILKEGSKSSPPNNHDENLKENQSEETSASKKIKKNIPSADITTEMSTKTESESKMFKKLTVNHTKENISQEENKSSVPSTHDENLKENQSDITTEISTKNESEAKVYRKLVVNIGKISPSLLPVEEESTPVKENTAMETIESNTSGSSFNLHLSSSVLESSNKNDSDLNVSPAGNKENIRPQEKPAELECEPMDVDDSDLENSFSSNLNKTQSPVVPTSSKVTNVTQELRIAEKVTNEIDQFLKEEITYTSANSPIKTKRNRLSLKNSSSTVDQNEVPQEKDVEIMKELSEQETVEVQEEKDSSAAKEKSHADTILEKDEQSSFVPPSCEEIKEDVKASLSEEKIVQAVDVQKEKEKSTLKEKTNVDPVLDKHEDVVEEDKQVEEQEEPIEAVSSSIQSNEISFGEDTEESFKLEIAETDSLTEEVFKDVEENIKPPVCSADTEKDSVEKNVVENNEMQSSSVELKENELDDVTTTEISEKSTHEIKEITMIKKSAQAVLESENVTNEDVKEKMEVDETSHETVGFKKPVEESIQSQDQTASEIEPEDDSQLMVESEKSVQTDKNEGLNEESPTKLQESNSTINDTDKLDNVVSITHTNTEKTDLGKEVSVSLTESKYIEDNDPSKVSENEIISENCVNETFDVSQISVEKESSEDSSIEIPKAVFGKSSKVNVIIKSDILIRSPNRKPLKKNALETEKSTELIDEKSAENEKVDAKEDDNDVTNIMENKETFEESNIEVIVNSIVQEVEECVSPKKEYRSPQKKVRSKPQILPIDSTISNSSEEETDTIKEIKQNAVSGRDVELIDSKYEIVTSSKQKSETAKEESSAVGLFEEIVVVSDNEKDEESSEEKDKVADKEENEERNLDTKETIGEILVSSDSECEVKEVLVQENAVATVNDNSNSIKRRSVDKTSIVMQGSIKAGDDKEKCLSNRIHKVVDLFCAGIGNNSDVSINVSLEYTGNFSESDEDTSSKKDTLQVSLTAVEDPKEKQRCDAKGSKRRKLYHPNKDEALLRSADVSESKSENDLHTSEENKDNTDLVEENVQKNVKKMSKNRNKKFTAFSESDVSYESPQMFKKTLTEEKEDYTSPVKKQRTYKDTPYKSAKSNRKLMVEDGKKNKQENVGKETDEDGTTEKRKKDEEFSETEDSDEEENEENDQEQTEWKPFSKYFSSVSESESETVNEDENDSTWAPSREIDSSDSDLSSEDLDDKSDISLEEEESPTLIIRSPLIGQSCNKPKEETSSEQSSFGEEEEPSFICAAKTTKTTIVSKDDEVFNRNTINAKSPSPKRSKKRKHSHSEVAETLKVEEVKVVKEEKKKQKSPAQKKKKGEENQVPSEEVKKSAVQESSIAKNLEGKSRVIENKPKKRSHSTHSTSEEFSKAKKPSVVSRKAPKIIVDELSTSKLQVTKKEYTKPTHNKPSKKLRKMAKTTYLKPSTSMSTNEWEVKTMS